MDSWEEEIGRMLRQGLFVVCALSLPSSALAQAKTSESVDCDKAIPNYAIPVPDREGFGFALGQNKCVFSKAAPIEELQAKEFIATLLVEVTGATASVTAAGVTRYDNGDKVFTRSTGTEDLKELTGAGEWTYTGGTEKLAGIKGGSTSTCKSKSADPGAGHTCDAVGQYTLPLSKAEK